MDAVTPKAKHDTLDTHSHVVRPAQMEWKKTRFAGCEVKGLLLDKETGVVTGLMRFAPGAVLPDHEHVKIEQTYVLEGKLVDKDGPAKGLTVGPGEFVWREAATSPGRRKAGLCSPCSRSPISSSRPTAGSPTFPAPTGTKSGGMCSRTRHHPGCRVSDRIMLAIRRVS
jgi:quercetin dioxygenase-like cupin family protein